MSLYYYVNVTSNAHTNTPLSNMLTFHSSPPGTSFLEKCTSIKARATCCFSAANKPEGHTTVFANVKKHRNHRKVVLPLKGLCLDNSELLD